MTTGLRGSDNFHRQKNRNAPSKTLFFHTLFI